MQELGINLMDILKKCSPYIMGGVIGTVIHAMRTKMNLITFLKSLVMSVFISTCVGIVCKHYLQIENEYLIFVFCGMSGAFSNIILDELEKIIKLSSVFVKSKIDSKSNNSDNNA